MGVDRSLFYNGDPCYSLCSIDSSELGMTIKKFGMTNKELGMTIKELGMTIKELGMTNNTRNDNVLLFCHSERSEESK
ncbi:hypothetical protein ACVWYN_000033 [Pedobacter sp. UYP24]